MYPSGELRALAARKALLQARIAVRRWQCATHAAELARPVAWLDRAWAQWRRISPLVKLLGIPAGIFLGRKVTKHGGKFSGLLRYAPLVMQAVRMVTQAKRPPKVPAETSAAAAR